MAWFGPWGSLPTFSGTQDEWKAVCIVNGGEEDELACDSDGRITLINVKQALSLACPLGLSLQNSAIWTSCP